MPVALLKVKQAKENYETVYQGRYIPSRADKPFRDYMVYHGLELAKKPEDIEIIQKKGKAMTTIKTSFPTISRMFRPPSAAHAVGNVPNAAARQRMRTECLRCFVKVVIKVKD